MKKKLLNIFLIVLTGIFLLVFTFALWVIYRGTQPLEINEARGLSFWRFLSERWQRWDEVNTRISLLPQYAGCQNNILRFTPINLTAAIKYTVASLRPGSELAAAFHYWEEHKPDPTLPIVQPITITQAPDTFWDYLTRAYWRGLVSIDHLAGECALGPVNYDALMGAAE